jgi:hypothetical protein
MDNKKRVILQSQKLYGEYLLRNFPYIHSSIPLISMRSINKRVIIDLPREFDSRKQWPGKINKNGDQFGSGCCYLFGALYAFSDRYAIFRNENYIRMSVVEIAAVERIFSPDGSQAKIDNKERSGKSGCINCDPFQNGMGSDIFSAISVYGTVADVDNDPNFSFAKFCKDYSNCSCPSGSPDSYCDDDSWKNYQTDLSKKLPNDISIYSNVQKYPTEEEKKGMEIYNISPENYDFSLLANNVYTGGPIGIAYFFGPDFTRENYNETGGIYICTDWQDDSNPFGYKAKGKSGSGGHYISIIGFGTQTISYKYKGNPQTQDIHYYLCRNSWGENDHSFFKAASNQKAGGIELMKGVWGLASFVVFSKPIQYKCINGVCNPCVHGETDCVSKDICDQGCTRPISPTYKCVNENCVMCSIGESCRYQENTCNKECKAPPVIKGKRCNFTSGNCEECIMGRDENCGECNFCTKMYMGDTCIPCAYSSVGCNANKNCKTKKGKIWIIIGIVLIVMIAIFVIYKFILKKY